MNPQKETSARDRIVATALDLFYRQGYLATGINQIIAESEVAKATFYAHFPSKEALCIAYLQARHVLWMGWLKKGVAGAKNSRERLLAVFSFLETWMHDSDFRGCAFLNIASEVPSFETKIRDEVKRHKDDLQRFLQETITDICAAAPHGCNVEARQAAKMVYVLIEGAIVASQNYHDSWPIASARQAAQELLDL